MKSRTFMHQLDLVLRGLTPILLTLALVVIARLPFGFEEFETAMPLLILMCVYYWTIYRPQLLPPVVIFLFGLLHDLMTNGPIGLMALVLLLVYWLVDAQRRVFLGSSFVVGWWGFGLVAVGAETLIYLLASFYYDSFLNLPPFALQLALTIAVYPGIAWAFGLMQRLVFSHERD